MKWRRSGIFTFSRAFLLVALLFCGLVTTQAQSSQPTSPPQEALWQQLLPLTQNLPTNFNSFLDNLTLQIEQLQASNQELQNSNASLTESLAQLKAQVATLEAKSRQLQTDLDASTSSITKAQAQAKALENQNRFLKIIAIAAGVVCVGVIGYEQIK